MKFWKILSSLIEETLPDWRDEFLSYKDLKKHLKRICPKDGDDGNPKPIKRPKLTDEDCSELMGEDDRAVDSSSVDGGEAPVRPSKDEMNDFVKLLEDEIEKFNAFFVEKEEEYVIKWKELQDRAMKANESSEELMKVGREIVDLHGEMILLENYSALNYTGLVKILKKHDKRSGTLIRLPFIQEILQQPFYSNDTLCKLIKECEATLDHLFAENHRCCSAEGKLQSASPIATDTESSNLSMASSRDPNKGIPGEPAEIKHAENVHMRLTLSALRALREIRGGSSTVSVFSLPPLHGGSSEEDSMWKKARVVEQIVK